MCKWSRLFVTIVFVIAVATLTYICMEIINERVEHLVTWSLYHGEFQSGDVTYSVEIDESDRGNGIVRLVHMRPVGKPSYVGITGHDYNNDNQFDRVFYCGNHELVGQAPSGEFGCNSVVRTTDGWVFVDDSNSVIRATGWMFEPCPADDGVVQPFSKRAINFALAELHEATYHLYNEDNLSERWQWDSEQKKVVKVYSRTS